MRQYGNDFDWLENFTTVLSNGALAVSNIVPTVFDRYFIVENNYGIIDEFPFDDYPEHTQSIENLNKRHNIERQYGLFLNNDTEHLYRPLSIKDIAARFDVPYSRDSINTIKQTPGIRCLGIASRQNLIKLVELLVTTECYLFIRDINRYGLQEGNGYSQKNIIGNSSEYLNFVNTVGLDYCSYLFPKVNTWCLSTYEDVDNLILSCNDETADVLTSVGDLEYFEVHPETVLRNLW